MMGYQRTQPYNNQGGNLRHDREFDHLIRARISSSEPDRGYTYRDPSSHWFAEVTGQLGDELWCQIESVSVFKPSEDDARLISLALRGEIDEQKLRKRFEGAKKANQLFIISVIPIQDGAERESDLKWRVKLFLDFAEQAKDRKRDSDRLKCEEAVEEQLKNLGALVGMTSISLRMLAADSVADKLKMLGRITRGDIICKLSQT